MGAISFRTVVINCLIWVHFGTKVPLNKPVSYKSYPIGPRCLVGVIKLRLRLYVKQYLLWKYIYHHISVPLYISNAVTFSANLTAYTIWRSAVALPHFLSLSLRRIALFVRRHLRCRYPALCGDRIRSPTRFTFCLFPSSVGWTFRHTSWNLV
jgi:hypothetical protein